MLEKTDEMGIFVALNQNAEVFVSKEGKLKRKAKGLLEVKEPEESL